MAEHEMTLSEGELEKLTVRCRQIPRSSNVYRNDDFVIALVETVIDYQQHRTTVLRALEHFKNNRWGEIRTMEDLEACLARFPNDQPGNEQLARYLWGYRLWTRAEQLRGLVDYFDGQGVSALADLEKWAGSSAFRDFKGQIRGLGFAIFQWLRMRLGGNTVKPDSRILGFVGRTIGRPVHEVEAVEALEEVARRLRMTANDLDWSIWDYLEPGTVPLPSASTGKAMARMLPARSSSGARGPR